MKNANQFCHVFDKQQFDAEKIKLYYSSLQITQKRDHNIISSGNKHSLPKIKFCSMSASLFKLNRTKIQF